MIMKKLLLLGLAINLILPGIQTYGMEASQNNAEIKLSEVNRFLEKGTGYGYLIEALKSNILKENYNLYEQVARHVALGCKIESLSEVMQIIQEHNDSALTAEITNICANRPGFHKSVVDQEAFQQWQDSILAAIPNSEEQVTEDEALAQQLQDQENRHTPQTHFTWHNFFWSHKKAILFSCLLGIFGCWCYKNIKTKA